MKNNSFLTTIVVLIIAMSTKAQVLGTFTDSRDSKTYKTVQIGKQTWLAQNFNNLSKCSFCYSNTAVECEKYGRLYAMEAAGRNTPKGWHLPFKSELFDAVKLLGGTVEEIVDTETVGYGPDVKEYILVNVYDKLISSLNLKAGGQLFDDDKLDYSELGEFGYYWLQSESRTAGWYLYIDFQKKKASVCWLNDYDAQDCESGYQGRRFSVLYLLNYESSDIYWELGWFAYEIWDDLDKAIEYSKKCIAIDNTLGPVYANLGLFYLIKDNIPSANEYYNLAIINIKKNKEKSKASFKAVIDDINYAKFVAEMENIDDENKKLLPIGYVEILKKLQAEYDKL